LAVTLPRPVGSRAAAGLRGRLEAHALFIVAVCAVVGLSLIAIPHHLAQDGWLALVAGRDVAAHGIPHHDLFTVMAHGAPWVDQQWLAQLVMYELVHLGGLQLMTVVYVLITGAAFAFALAGARQLGAEDLHVLMVLPAGAFFYLMTAVSIRTQGLAYPLFVATVWLLAAESRGDERRARVYLVFPMLVLWANVHGSVTVGAGLACLYGLTLLAGAVQRDGPRGLADGRAWAFVVLAPLTPLATPYGTQIIRYYRATLLNPQFAKDVTEWRPLTSIPILAAALALTVAAACYVLLAPVVRARAHVNTATRPATRPLAGPTPLFDLLVMAALTAGAVLAVRNVTWFGLALVILGPAAVTRLTGKPAPLRRVRVNGVLALVIAGLTVCGSLAVLTRPAAWFTSTYPSGAVATLQRLVARDPHAKIFADVRYADWLVWEDPREFAGRVAYDTSFELLTAPQLSFIADPTATSEARVLSRYAIWMLYPSNRKENRTLLKRPGVRAVVRDAKVIIATDSVGLGGARGGRGRRAGRAGRAGRGGRGDLIETNG